MRDPHTCVDSVLNWGAQNVEAGLAISASAGGAHHDFERLIRRVIRYFLTSESV